MSLLVCRERLLHLNHTQIMGILNVTPDSFSDGGAFTLHDTAVKRALGMEAEGAAIIDVGGESTRPGAITVSVKEEIQRVVPVIKTLSRTLKKSLISVDTSKSDVARAALDAGAHMVNDVTGLWGDVKMAGIVATAGAGVVLMHSKGTPQTMQQNPVYENVMQEVYQQLSLSISRAVHAGVAKQSIMIDPGIGFGKTVAHNVTLLRCLPDLLALGYPLMVGASRKSFIGDILNAPVEDRLEGSLAAAVMAVAGGARLVRVHDVRETCRAVRIADAVRGEYVSYRATGELSTTYE